jgi:hypothetical protein
MEPTSAGDYCPDSSDRGHGRVSARVAERREFIGIAPIES